MTTAPTRPVGPPGGRPAWQDLFREPVYADGPYDRGDEDEDPETDGIITP